MSSLKRCTGVLSGALLLAAASHAQTTTAALDPDSAGLYAAFFQFHSDVANWAAQQKATNAHAAQTLDASMALHFKLDPGDLGKMTGVTNNVMASFKKIDKDQQDYMNRRAKSELFPEPAVMQQYAQQRAQAALDGADKLQKLLSPASWAGLHDYINNIHRLRFRTIPGK